MRKGGESKIFFCYPRGLRASPSISDIVDLMWKANEGEAESIVLLISDIVDLVWKANKGEAESIVLLIFVHWWCFYCWWVRGGEVVGCWVRAN